MEIRQQCASDYKHRGKRSWSTIGNLHVPRQVNDQHASWEIGLCLHVTNQQLVHAPNWSVLLMAKRLVAVSLTGSHSCQALAALFLRSGNANSAAVITVFRVYMSGQRMFVSEIKARHRHTVIFYRANGQQRVQ